MTAEDFANWTKESDDVKAVLERRFPDIKCFRCGHDEFGLRIFADDDYTTIKVPKKMNQLAELICSSCGHIERYLVDYLLQDHGNRSND